jgi:hypothetical protein
MEVRNLVAKPSRRPAPSIPRVAGVVQLVKPQPHDVHAHVRNPSQHSEACDATRLKPRNQARIRSEARAQGCAIGAKLETSIVRLCPEHRAGWH